ncbi:MAG: ParB/RepB/Spo0J family partition protein [Gammaproteobacteria bacterium]
MVAKKRGLGRGLDALLGAGVPEELTSDTAIEGEELRAVPVDLIQRGEYQPRRDIEPEALQELSDSIKAQGVIQPIVIRPIGEGRYEIVAGERRWRATQMAGLQEIPAVVREMPDKVALSVAIIENIQREDLNPLEEAISLDRLLTEFDLTHQLVADAVGRSRVAVSNLLRLLELEEEVKNYLSEGKLGMGHARALLPLGSIAQKQVARNVISKQLSVRQTEVLVRKLQDQKDNSPVSVTTHKDPNVNQLEEKLAEQLGAKVALKHNPKGKGTIVIHFNSLDELDGILDHIK